MPKTLTLSAPKQFSTFYGESTVTWGLLDEKGVGYRISWIAKALDTHMPECIAFACCGTWFQDDFVTTMDENDVKWVQDMTYCPVCGTEFTQRWE